MREIKKKLFIDLKYFSLACHSLAFHCEEMADEFRKNNICADHGLLADLRIPAMRRAISRELQSQKLFLLGSFFEHGLCPTEIIDYNEQRPHDSPDDMTPAECLSENTRNSIFQLSA